MLSILEKNLNREGERSVGRGEWSFNEGGGGRPRGEGDLWRQVKAILGPTPQFKSIKSLFFEYACIKCSSIFWRIPSLFNFLWSTQWRQEEYIASYIVKCYQRSWKKKDTGHFQSIYSESASGWHWLKYHKLQNVWKKVNLDQQKYFGPSSEDSFGCHDFHVF